MGSGAFSESYDSLIKSHWEISKDGRILLVGLEDTCAFGPEATAGAVVDSVQAAEANVAEVQKAMDGAAPKRVLATLSECFELPGYTNALRQHFECPVYDAIT